MTWRRSGAGTHACHGGLQAGIFALLSLLTPPGFAQSVELTRVISKPLSRTVELPAEIAPYLSVAVHAKVSGYVERVLVDRGSAVKNGDTLVELSAPEMDAQIAEADARVRATEAEELQAEAQLAGAQGTAEHMQDAAKTPGAIAGNDLLQAQKQVDAAKALVEARKRATSAASAAVDTLRRMQQYLKITAPFDGVVTDRLVHPGALVGPTTDAPLLHIQQLSRLRVVVAVPEEEASAIVNGANVQFHVPAYRERTFHGTVARPSRSLDAKTRTMPVELDVANLDRALSPGMYASVEWPVRRSGQSLFVPTSSVVSTTERTFVIRNQNGHAAWVDVHKGESSADLVEVFGDLRAGDQIVRRATDEIRDGSPLLVPAK